jgi:deazaflavin-dependent oxidoreductase (nitroreductase family)
VAALKKSKLVELFWKVHPWLYKLSGGAIGGRIIGMPVLLLTTKGRKSGVPRERALTYVPDGSSFVVIASYLGEPRHPDWYLNLKARPEADVLVGRERVRVRAREAQGAERDRLWQAAVGMNADYDEYRSRTTRQIPVVILERQA